MDNETRRGGDPGQETPAAEGTAAADLEKQAAAGDLPKRQTKMLILPGEIDPETAEKAAIIFDKYPGLFEKAGLVKTVRKYTLPDGGTVLTTAPLQKKGDNMSDQSENTAAEGGAFHGTAKKPEPAQLPEDVRRAIDLFLKEQQRTIAEVQRIVQGVDIDALQAFFDELKRLEPYMAAIMKTDPRFEGLTIDDLLSRYNLADVRNIEQGDPLFDLLEKAKETEGRKRERETLPTITYKKQTPGIELTLDKLTTVFFGAGAPPPRGQIAGQMSFIPVKYETDGAPEITLFYNYSFDNDILNRYGLKNKIDDEDYFILSFLWDFYKAGNTQISITRLYREMTGDNPNETQRTELTKKLIKLASTTIVINDLEVRKAWNLPDPNENKRKKGRFREVVTPLAPIKVGAERFIANGGVAEGGIMILAAPDIIELGYSIGQYTTIPKKLLMVTTKDRKGKIRKAKRSPRFYRVLHYLIRRIASMKSGHMSNKILYETFYKETGETSIRAQQLALKQLYIILDYFKTVDSYITGYREEISGTSGKEGVVIYFKNGNKPQPQIPMNRNT